MTYLTQNNSFNPELLSTLDSVDLDQDRLPGDILVLPYDLNDVKVSVNDFVVSDTINYSLDRLYDNWLYLISNSIIPSNNIPDGKLYTRMVCDMKGTQGITWIDKTLFPTVSSNIQSGKLSGVQKITKIKNTANSNDFNLIATTQTNIILLSGTGDTSIDIIQNPSVPSIKSDSDITHPSNNIRFENIQDHTLNNSKELFVADSQLDIIVKFDISGIMTLDKAILNNDTPGRLMTELIGGPGELNSKTKFKNIISMTSVDDLVYVLDHDPASGTVMKQFDSQLNWKSNNQLPSEISGPVDVKFNTDTRKFYILCHETTYSTLQTGTLPRLVILNEDMSFAETVDLMEPARHSENIQTEKFKELHFSIENPNIMYIVTTNNIYKKYVSRPSRFIGRFLLTEKSIGTGDTGDMIFSGMSIDDHVITSGGEQLIKDEIMLLESNFEVIHRFIEDSNYEQSLETTFDDKVLYREDLFIGSEESVNSVVYNKTIVKHIYNNALLLENTSRKFSTTFDAAGISRYIGFKYLNIDELNLLNYTPTLDNYIGVNEPVTTHTVNRCIEQILLLQDKILQNMQEKSTNVYPLISEPVMLNY